MNQSTPNPVPLTWVREMIGLRQHVENMRLMYRRRGVPDELIDKTLKGSAPETWPWYDTTSSNTSTREKRE